MEPTIFRYILRHSLRQQMVLLLLTLASFPFLYASLDLPKTIINKAIGAHDFPKIAFAIPLTQIQYLLTLCAIFLALVLINGAFKYTINVFRGRLGERMLRRLRYELYSRTLRFPLPHFRRMSQGEMIAMITAEVEPLGGFIGDAFALPIFQGGTLVTIVAFVFVQDPVLGLAAVALYPLQVYVIPRLQRRVNELGKQRVRTVRRLSQRIGETVTAIQEIRANDTSELERAHFAQQSGLIYAIRYEIYRRKFIIKFLNNFLAQVTPFFFYSIGGYLVIEGNLTFGALVAVLAAYKDMSAPWKELLDYYQQKEDARIKYEQLVDQFQPSGMLDEALQRPPAGPVPPLAGALRATNLTLEEEGGIKVVDGVTTTLPLDRQVAVVGPSGAGQAALAQLLARLVAPTAGTITVDGKSLANLPESVIGRRMGFVDQGTQLQNGSLKDNLVYGLKHQPLVPVSYEPAAAALRAAFAAEAVRSGNTASDVNAHWIDHAAAGVAGDTGLDKRLIELLRTVELAEDVYALGLQGTLDSRAKPELAARILDARAALRRRIEEANFAGLVEPFDRGRYNTNMMVAENLLFGYPVGPEFDLDHLGANAYMLAVLNKAGLTRAFLEMGVRLAAVMVELFRDLPPDHEYHERFSFIGADEMPQFQLYIRRAESVGLDKLDENDRHALISLPFKIIPDRHRLGLIDDAMQARILVARHMFADDLPEELHGAVAFLDETTFNPAASILDNILFGKMVYGRHQAHQQIGGLIREVIDQLGLGDALIELGLETQAGVGGSRLTLAQRQKLALARTLLKRPDVMIVNDATAALDPPSQASILENVLAERRGRGVIWVLSRLDLASRFEHIMVIERGRIAEQGTYDELDRPGTRFHALRSG